MPEKPVKSTVFIVDDHPIVRQGLALLINREQDLAVCGDVPGPAGRPGGR